MNGDRLAAALGVASAVLLVLGLLVFSNTPASDGPDEEWLDYINDNGATVVIRAYMLLLAGLGLVGAFAFGLRPRMDSSAPIDKGFVAFATASTIIAATMLAAGGLVGAAVGAAHEFADVPVDVGLARTFDNFLYGFVLVGVAGAMAVTMAIVAVQAARLRQFPAWMMWVSILGVIGMLTSLAFIPFLLLPIWLIAVSAAVLMRPTISAS